MLWTRDAPTARGPLSEGDSRRRNHHVPIALGQFALVTGEARGPPPAEPLKIYEVRVEGADIFTSIVK